MNDWREFDSKNYPDDGETVLIVSLSTDGVAVVQFATFHRLNGEKCSWDLYEPLDVGTITHWCRIPKLPAIHDPVFMGRA